MTDMKQTLATAFDDEPPLSIDRAAILKVGRRKATFRRGYTGAAVLATVAAVAVPALLWSGAGGGSGGADLQVAAGQSSATTVPSEPTLTTEAVPATTESAPATTETTKPGSSNAPSSMAQPQPPKPVTPERAAELGVLLAGSGAIPADAQGTPVPQSPMDPWTFRISNANAYLSLTDVTTPVGRGSVLLHLYPGEAACEAADTSCQSLEYGGKAVAVSTQEHNGITLVTVRTATPDGAVMSAQTSNSSDKATSNGTAPPLTWEQLAKIATHPGFAF
ncbi:hypothetical protein [Saccharothrix sp. NRRL B-16314]|uniref:hypothetical protein n=1 Tax=Saccharothrix sp. NRRL B-16314 TaxID=1463825 RepID=UPI000526B73D|nr:hypothetical protein [Saccharothrix sp. NRRL B-16314]